MVPSKVKQFTDLGHEVRGVIHVGAHEGQEIPYYLENRHTPVVAIEPNPRAVDRLRDDYAGEPVVVIAAALSDRNGRADLWIPRHLHDASDDDQSASLHRADRESGYDWGGRDLEGRTIPVVLWRGDDLLDPLPDHYNTLVIDVQGHEYEVLRGFGDLLGCFDNLIVECSNFPIYEGGQPAAVIATFLHAKGFDQLNSCDYDRIWHDDILFRRRAS